jgi:TonB-linked SusC/RagA family outer membrane protein
VDAGTRAPVAGAQVFIPGTVIGTVTSELGTYRLTGVPSGSVTVMVRLIGYKEASQQVEIAAGQAAALDLQLEQTALRLQDIVVTGLVAETPRVKLPFTVERLDTEDLPVTAPNVSALLSGKAPGVTVLQPNGQPGEQASIILRAPTSIDGSGRTQAPLIVVDGVIQSDNATLADISSLDVDHFEIVKGAAAASLYGSRAQNGVIQITTKRGTALAANTFQVVLRGAYGQNSLAGSIAFGEEHPYVMNESGTKFIDTNGNELDYGQFLRDGNGGPVLNGGGTGATAFRDGVFPGQLHDQIGRFFDPGETYSLYSAVTGRFAESSFRASFERFKEEGVVDCGSDCRNPVALENFGDDFAVRDDGYRRHNGRLNLDTQLGGFDFAASGFYSNSIQDDRAVDSQSFFRLIFMPPFVDLTEPDEDGRPRFRPDPLFLNPNPLYTLAVVESEERRSRVMGSLDAAWSPVPWLSIEANASYDRTSFDSFELHDKDEVSFDGTQTGGSLNVSNFSDEAINASLSLGATRSFLDGDLVLRGKARYLVEDQSFESNGVRGDDFAVEGVPTFGAIAGDQEGRRAIEGIRAQGYFGIAGLDYKGRYIFDGLLRRDGSSLFGPEEQWHTYFRGSAAWRVAQEDWWAVDWVDELKLRFSYGTAGGRPRFSAQYETYGISGGRIFPINLGNQALKPEFSTEREAGMNLVLFENLGIDYSYAWQNTDDQLLLVPQPSFVGFSAQWQNAGEIKANTHEVGVRWAAIDDSDVGLNFRLSWDRTRHVISRLNLEFTGSAFLVAEGEPLGSLWGNRWARTCDDVAGAAGLFSSAGFDCGHFQVNDDGYMVFVGEGNSFEDGITKDLWGSRGEVAGTRFDWGMPVHTKAQSPACLRKHPDDAGVGERCALTDFLPLGNTTPDWNGSFAADLRYRGLKLNVLLDAAVGFEILNSARQIRLRDGHHTEGDQGGKPEGFKKPLDYFERLYNANQENPHFIEDGSWLKVREVSLGYTLPETWLRRAFKGHVDRVTVGVIGRNLFTFTGYSGYDPEVGRLGTFGGYDVGAASIVRWDSANYPNFRTITASLEVVF